MATSTTSITLIARNHYHPYLDPMRLVLTRLIKCRVIRLHDNGADEMASPHVERFIVCNQLSQLQVDTPHSSATQSINTHHRYAGALIGFEWLI